jgi:hypothetical protein
MMYRMHQDQFLATSRCKVGGRPLFGFGLILVHSGAIEVGNLHTISSIE